MEEPRARLAAYVDALLEAGAGLNLTAVRTPERAETVLVTPSLAVRGAWPAGRPAPSVAVDIGSGNGFPGVAVAVLWPTCRVFLVERRAKKARAIAACLLAAGIVSAEAVACDARELPQTCPAAVGADLVTLRAVTSLAEGNRLAASLLRRGGRVVHWKRAGQLRAETGEARRQAGRSGLRRLADVVHEDGVLVVYERSGQGGGGPR